MLRKKAYLWDVESGGRVLCRLCSHRCGIPEGAFGICGVRKNEGGELYTYAYGKVIANHVDPIEKKPLYHFLPGTYSYSVATIGCNFRCSFCQNWSISQLSAREGDVDGYELTPEEIVNEALRNGCRSISYTYTEPTIFFEYAYDTAKLAKKKGLYNNFVTKGKTTGEAIDMIRPYLDAANIDLKFFRDETYRKICKAKLQPVLDSIKKMKEEGIWIEVTTLVVPGENDTEEELEGIARFIAGTGKDIPWHISRFHPDYRFLTAGPTELSVMRKARDIGKKEGLKYVYLGNVNEGGETVCHDCGEILIRRIGFMVKPIGKFGQEGACPRCGSRIEGVWK